MLVNLSPCFSHHHQTPTNLFFPKAQVREHDLIFLPFSFSIGTTSKVHVKNFGMSLEYVNEHYNQKCWIQLLLTSCELKFMYGKSTWQKYFYILCGSQKYSWYRHWIYLLKFSLSTYKLTVGFKNSHESVTIMAPFQLVFQLKQNTNKMYDFGTFPIDVWVQTEH
jgi:hypothetical protein